MLEDIVTAPNADHRTRLLGIVLVPPFPSRLALLYCFIHELPRFLWGRL
jgi:hypothetical protein